MMDGIEKRTQGRVQFKRFCCGEMGSDPFSVLVLIGLNVDELSVSPNVIPEVKRIIRSVTFDQCRSLVKRVMRHKTTADIEADIEKFILQHVQNSRH